MGGFLTTRENRTLCVMHCIPMTCAHVMTCEESGENRVLELAKRCFRPLSHLTTEARKIYPHLPEGSKCNYAVRASGSRGLCGVPSPSNKSDRALRCLSPARQRPTGKEHGDQRRQEGATYLDLPSWKSFC